MKIKKRILCPERLRRIPGQFSWIDQRLVRDRYLQHCDHGALVLYLVLVTVADAEGLSYYSDADAQHGARAAARRASSTLPSWHAGLRKAVVSDPRPGVGFGGQRCGPTRHRALQPTHGRGRYSTPDRGRGGMIEYLTYCQI